MRRPMPVSLCRLTVALWLVAGCEVGNESGVPATPAAAQAVPRAPAPPASAGGDIDAAALANDPSKLLARIDALKGELGQRPRDFQVNVALGSLFYDNGRYIEGIESFTEALTQAKEAEARVVSLRTKGAFERTGPVPASCRQDVPDDASKQAGLATRALEATVAAARALDATDPGAAASCWHELVAPLALLRAKRGNAWYLIGNSGKSREDHDAALALDPRHPEALFFVGALTLELAKGDPAQLEAGRVLWQRLLDTSPEHPRAKLVRETLPRIPELFGRRGAAPAAPTEAAKPAEATEATEAAPSGPAPLPEGVAEAMAQVERTPELDGKLEALLDEGESLLARREWQAALDAFKQVMPLRPDGRVALGLGTALGRLGKPTAARVLEQAIRMPGGKPNRARLELARVLAPRDLNQAKALLAGIAADPEVGAEAKALLATLP